MRGFNKDDISNSNITTYNNDGKEKVWTNSSSCNITIVGVGVGVSGAQQTKDNAELMLALLRYRVLSCRVMI